MGKYLQILVFELADMFGINYEPCFFPHKFLTLDHLEFVGKIPNFEVFQDFYDNEITFQQKKLFLEQNNNKDWNLSEQLNKYADLKISLYSQTFLQFCLECFYIQNAFMKTFSKPLSGALFLNYISYVF